MQTPTKQWDQSRHVRWKPLTPPVRMGPQKLKQSVPTGKQLQSRTLSPEGKQLAGRGLHTESVGNSVTSLSTISQ